MTSEEKMREEFEEYFKRTRKIYPRMRADGSYDCAVQDCCWEFWKASRESLVIELTEMIGMNQPFSGTPIQRFASITISMMRFRSAENPSRQQE